MDAGRPVVNVRRVLRTTSNNFKRKSAVVPPSEKVKLERILGLTVSGDAAIDTDPHTGTIAYPAGCVVVLYNSKKNKQSHIFNASKKTITCIAFSRDGKHLVTGECGHQPAVRVWELEDYSQISEFQGHKFGVNCVAFSPNLKYIVSIGTQHDMVVNVWNWKSNSKVASNKVAANVTDVAFSEDGSYFVSVGNRHAKFWYLDASKSRATANETVPLMGRSGILGEQRNNFFCAVACGKGVIASKTFMITHSGLLCEFNEKRLLDKWVELRTSRASSICVSEKYIYIGCADGIVRVFSCLSLHYMASLPRPHYLGIDVSTGMDPSHIATPPPNARYPDVIALSFDENSQKITCIYKDNSMYIWDVQDIKRVGKSKSFLYHSSCIWGVDVYPEVKNGGGALPEGCFLTCSSDDTIRVWNLNTNMDNSTVYKRNIYSSELLKVIYTDPQLNYIVEKDAPLGAKNDKNDNTTQEKNGVRCVRVSPDGQHLASGDRHGNIRVHDLQHMDEVVMLEAHNAEVLALEYTKKSHGINILATASRDRLLHVFDRDQDYGLIQTLDDHSASVTAVRFTQQDEELTMISCGADKSLLFRNAQMNPDFQFVLNRHLVSKNTLYDMDVDPTQKFVATACQDRNVRIYNMKNGKQKKCYSGSIGTDGTLIRVELDNSGSFAVTSCSDKNLCVLDFFTGEIMASMYGHSEVVTGVKIMNDLKHVISVSGDGCIFVWRLPIAVVEQAQSRQMELNENKHLNGNLDTGSDTVDFEPKEDNVTVVDGTSEKQNHVLDNNANIHEQEKSDHVFNVGLLPPWAKKQVTQDANVSGGGVNVAHFPTGRWAQKLDHTGIKMKSVMDESFISLKLADCIDKRRFTVEPEEFTNDDVSDLRRETFLTANVPIITDDDENNVDEEEDDEFRLLTEGEIAAKNGNRLNSFHNHQTLEYKHSSEPEEKEEEQTIYYLPNKEEVGSPDALSRTFQVFEGDTTLAKDQVSECSNSVDDISDEENETSSTPSDTSKGFATPDQEKFLKEHFESLALKESFTNNIDDLVPDPTPTHNGHDESFISHRHSISTRFLTRAQQLELSKQAYGHSTPINSSLQRKRDETAKAVEDTKKRLQALGWKGNSEQSNCNSEVPLQDLPSPPTKLGWKGNSEQSNCNSEVPLQDLPSPPTKDQDSTRSKAVESGRRRNKPEIGSERRKTLGDVRPELTLSPVIFDSSHTFVTPSTLERKRWSSGGSRTPTNARKWQSMLDVSDSDSSSAKAQLRNTPRSKTPMSYGMSSGSGGRTLPPTPQPSSSRYARSTANNRKQRKFGWKTSKRARALASPSRKSFTRFPKASSTKMEIRIDGGSGGTQVKRSTSRTRSEKNIPAAIDASEISRRRLSKPSYMQGTSSSTAKSNSTQTLNKVVPDASKETTPSSASKKTGAMRRGRLSTGAKSKFKSTPNLAELSAHDTEPFDNFEAADDMRILTGSPDTHEVSAFKSPIKRSMPATKEHKDPYQNVASVTNNIGTISAEPPKSVWKRVTPEFKTELKAEILESTDNHNEGGDNEHNSSVKPRAMTFEDKFAMPPPQTVEVPNSRLAKITHVAKSSPIEITIDQAKDILLGKSNHNRKSDLSSYSNVGAIHGQIADHKDTPSTSNVQITSSSNVYSSAPWRSVYSNSGSNITGSTAVTSTVSTSSISSSSSSKPLSSIVNTKYNNTSTSDLDETPVKEEMAPARPRSRVEVTGILLGAVSSTVTQGNDVTGFMQHRQQNSTNTTDVFKSPVLSPRKSETPPTENKGPREGEPGDFSKISSSLNHPVPVKSILKHSTSFSSSSDTQFEEADCADITPDGSDVQSSSGKNSPDISMERPKATILSRNRENILNSLFSSGSNSKTTVVSPNTGEAVQRKLSSPRPELSLISNRPTTLQSHGSGRSPRRRTTPTTPVSPAAATARAQMDQAFKEHRMRKFNQQQQSSEESVVSKQNLVQTTQTVDNSGDTLHTNIQSGFDKHNSNLVADCEVTNTVGGKVAGTELRSELNSASPTISTVIAENRMDIASTDSASSVEDSPRTTVPANRTSLRLPLHTVHKPDHTTTEPEIRLVEFDDCERSMSHLLNVYAKLPDNHEHKKIIKAKLESMRDKLVSSLGSPGKTLITESDAKHFLEQYSAEMADQVYKLMEEKMAALTPGSSN